MSRDQGQTLRGLWLLVATAGLLLAAVGLGIAQLARSEQQRVAMAELQAVAGERKAQINAWLARARALSEEGMRDVAAMAELEALVHPRQRRWATEDSALYDALGRPIVALQSNDDRGEWVSANQPLPVNGGRLLVSVSRAEIMPSAPYQRALALLGAAEAGLLAAGLWLAWLLRRRSTRSRSSPSPEPGLSTPSSADNSAFLGGLSHEIRTPLNGVLGTLQLLLKTPLNPAQRELAEMARASGETLLAAVDDLLDHPPVPAGADSELTGAGPGLSGARVLLVEDNATNQIVARLMLAELGCTVDVAGDGQAALERLDAGEFDVLLMDCEMPVLDGFATTAAIRRRDDRKARVPIIAVTAQAMVGDRERCLAAGMNDYLSKPITEAGLASVLRRWLRPITDVPVRDPLPAPVDSAGQAINPVVIGRLRELAQATDPGLLTQILDAFRSDSAAHIASLRRAAESGDAAALCTAAHVIKGASGTIGARTLANLAQQVYAAGQGGSLAATGSMIDALVQEFSRVLVELDSLEDPSAGAESDENPDRR